MSTEFCSVIKKNKSNIDGEEAIVYGFEINGTRKYIFEDLCTDEQKIEKLCRHIEKYNPDPRHIPDIIDDYLYNI